MNCGVRTVLKIVAEARKGCLGVNLCHDGRAVVVSVHLGDVVLGVSGLEDAQQAMWPDFLVPVPELECGEGPILHTVGAPLGRRLVTVAAKAGRR